MSTLDTQKLTSIQRHSLSRMRLPVTPASPDGFSLYVDGHRDPIVVENRKEFIIGRRTVQDKAGPTVDLRRFNGANLGVSRRHAAVRLLDGEWMLEDLNSSNGTWLNEQRLDPLRPQPLRRGDLIRLGSCILYPIF